MSTAQGNIFLTTENLAFSLPLIFVCGSYAYFKYIPLEYGLPILGAAFVLYQIQAQIKKQRYKKLQNMDEKAINDLALELEGEKADDKAEKAKKLSKKKAQVEYRLAAERKREAKNKKKGVVTDDDDGEDYDDLATFAKGSRKKKN